MMTRAPIDDEQMRHAIARMRWVAFVCVSALIGAGVVRFFEMRLSDRWPFLGWVAAFTTAALAGWAVRGRRSVLAAVWRRPALAGVLNGLSSLLLFVVGQAVERPFTPSGGFFMALLVMTIVAAVTGAVIGSLFGAALAPLWWLLERLGARPTLATMPLALCATAVWSAGGLALAVPIGTFLPGASLLAGVLAGVSVLVAIAASIELLRRRRLVARAERGEVDGWRVERDEDGTRWLVREERGGEGAYREGVVSRRWARV